PRGRRRRSPAESSRARRGGGWCSSSPHPCAGSGLGSLFTPKVLAECRINARLPTRSASAKPIDHVMVETQGYELLGRVGRRPAASAPDQRIADMEIGLGEPLVGQFGDLLVLL